MPLQTRRRSFLAGMAAIACSGCGEGGLSSVIPGTVPAEPGEPWPDPILDVADLTARLENALRGTRLADLGELVAMADEELRAVAALSPVAALLGASTLERLVFPALDTASLLRDAEDMAEDELGAHLAGAFDMSGLADEFLPLLQDTRVDLAQVGAWTLEGERDAQQPLRELARVLRGELAVAGQASDPFARQLVHELDKLAVEAGRDESLLDRATTALQEAPDQPAPPPFASLCTNLQYVADNWDRRRHAIASYLAVTQRTGALTSRGTRWTVRRLLKARFGYALPLLIGIGLAFLVAPFLLHQPPSFIRILHHRMCDCEGA